MPREILDHVTGSELNDSIKIKVLDEPGPGGACHQYMYEYPYTSKLPQHMQESIFGSSDGDDHVVLGAYVNFQKGPVKEAGINGISDEALLAVLIDRAQGFAKGPYKCRENDEALYHLNKALEWKQARTAKRIERGVEGTMEK